MEVNIYLKLFHMHNMSPHVEKCSHTQLQDRLVIIVSQFLLLAIILELKY